MLKQYKGRLLSSAEPITSTSSGSGMWALEEYMQGRAAGTWPLPTQFVEDVFSTYLYTGAPSGQTITNGIDLSGQGGMVWIKGRTNLAGGSPTLHLLTDTNRGAGYTLQSHLSDQQFLNSSIISSFTSSGFSIGTEGHANENGTTFASWTFRKAPKFFDIVTYTGNGVSDREIPHNLGSAPGCIIIKATSVGGTPAGWIVPADWWVYHRGLPSSSNFSLRLNTTAGQDNSGGLVTSSSTFTIFGNVAASNMPNNVSGVTYVAYLYAHDASSDGIVQCGSVTDTTSTPATVNLGWEPQWILMKKITTGGGNQTLNDDWYIADDMRGLGAAATTALLYPNLSGSEGSQGFSPISINSTGFNVNGAIDQTDTFIYIAIRRGPMRTPALGTSVFAPVAYSGTGGATQLISTSFPVDAYINRNRASTNPNFTGTRLTGSATYLTTDTTNNATNLGGGNGTNNSIGFMSNVGLGVAGDWNNSSVSYVNWNFRRAPGFFDVVCYTGNGVARTISHNLGIAPELIMIKATTNGAAIAPDWTVRVPALGVTSTVFLNLPNGAIDYQNYVWNNTNPTSTTVSLSLDNYLTNSITGSTYVMYLFASVPDVSKVGNYTGNGNSQTINCAFTTGARFVLIKRTDSTGDWYVWDSARGIITGNDPYLSLNNTSTSEVTTNDSIDPYSTGFIVNQLSATNINVNNATYIFLAIA